MTCNSPGCQGWPNCALCGIVRMKAERDRALALLREIRETHFLKVSILPRVDALLAEGEDTSEQHSTATQPR